MNEPAPLLLPEVPSTSSASPPPMLSTRLYPPRPRSNLVARTRLLARLEDDPERRLTLICAPAGYGKSTLAGQWVRHLALPTAWVALEAADNDPAAFFGLIIAAVHRIDPDLAATVESLLTAGGTPVPEALMTQLIADLSVTTRPFVLVLDDYQAIAAPELHQAMDLLLQHRPPAMRLVLLSRVKSPLRLARLETSGELLVLTQADLQFSPEETHNYFHDVLVLDLTPSEIDLLLEQTEGWVTGLQLVGTALRGRERAHVANFVQEFVSKPDLGDRYLWEEVLEYQPDEVRSFLLHTAILDRFNADLCDAVTGTRNGVELLRWCERENLFLVPLVGQGAWYRHHHLFADTLRDQLSRTASEDDIADLHRRAAAWLEANGFVEEAIRHAMAGRDWDHAVRLLEEVCGELFERDHIATLRSWLQGIPPHVLATSPRLAFWLSWAHGRTGRWAGATAPLRMAEEAWTASGDHQGEELILLWHAARLLWAGDNLQAITFAQRALEHQTHERPTERILALMTRGIGHVNRGEPVAAEAMFAEVRTVIDTTGRPWLRPFEMTYSAAVLIEQGKLPEASLLCRQVIRAICDKPEEIWCQAALYELGRIYLEWGQLEEARLAFRQADDQAARMQTLHWRSQIRVGLARVAWAEGVIEEAFDEIEQAIAFATQLGTLQFVRDAYAQQARFWLKSHRLGLARRWAESSDLDPYLPPEYERQIEHLTYARLLIAEGRPELALPILQRIDQHAAEAGREGERVEMLLLIALAHKARDSAAEVFTALQAALELGSGGGYLRTFADEREELATLLRHAQARVSHRDYVKSILAEIAKSAPVAPLGSLEAPDALSEREVEVLRLVAEGLANRDIGQRLFISEKTVKTHLSNIMGKLGAANRTQAVDQGRHLGLL